MKKSSPLRASALSTAKDSAMWDRAPLAKTMPLEISSANAIIFLRSVASTMRGSSPTRGTAWRSLTNFRTSPSGLPVRTPRRSIAGAWLTPMPKSNLPFDVSWMKLAACAKSCTWRV